MMQCVAEGHEIVALANLRPRGKDELDSYMYQTVGHHAIDFYKEAMGLPLYRRNIEGASIEMGRDYVRNDKDEVEDLFELLKTVMEDVHIDAVSVGAILSDYQRVRVENVCSRLGLTSLAYLWRRDQTELLQEMIECRVEAVIIKVAAMGLKPSPHLMMPLSTICPIMLSLKSKYGLNVCGEGGEFETFTLDCPLFNKKIVVDKVETVIHSDDAFAPVGYINFTKMHLEEKDTEFVSISPSDRLKALPMKRSHQIYTELGLACPSDADLPTSDADLPTSDADLLNTPPVQDTCTVTNHSSKTFSYDNNIVTVSNIFGTTSETDMDSVECATRAAMDNLKEALMGHNLTLGDAFMMHMYVKDMTLFAVINSAYKEYFGINPPARICVEADLPEHVLLQVDCMASSSERSTMHVQGLSHWAPANIGPYSQAVKVGSKVYVAGQIALCPATMKIIEGGIEAQSHLSLRHVVRVLAAMHPSLLLHDVTMAICYVTMERDILEAEKEWKRVLKIESEMEDFTKRKCVPLLEVVVVSGLPRGALVEWQVVATLEEEDYDDYNKPYLCNPNRNATRDIILNSTWRETLTYGKGNVVYQQVYIGMPDDLKKENGLNLFNCFVSSIRDASMEKPTRWLIFFRVDVYQYSDLLEELADVDEGMGLTSYVLVPVRGFKRKDCNISICSILL